jgi:Fuc2NAc and GlcNAc transferase
MVAGCILVGTIGCPVALDLGFFQISAGHLLPVISVIGIAWLVNLTNFMDGIDGLAGAECAFVMGTGGVLLLFRGDETLSHLCFAFAAAAAGFLIVNWSPARIFMGDVGSGYIGLLCGAVILIDMAREPLRVWVWLILLGTFLTDATVTLIRRVLAGIPVFTAHRTHAYQHAAVLLGHSHTTSLFTAVNVLWLAPLAILASEWPRAGLVVFVIAVSPLIAIAWWLGAGLRSITGTDERNTRRGVRFLVSRSRSVISSPSR